MNIKLIYKININIKYLGFYISYIAFKFCTSPSITNIGSRTENGRNAINGRGTKSKKQKSIKINYHIQDFLQGYLIMLFKNCFSVPHSPRIYKKGKEVNNKFYDMVLSNNSCLTSTLNMKNIFYCYGNHMRFNFHHYRI